MMARTRVFGVLAFTSIVALTGCARGCTSSRPPIHLNPSMDNQPKVIPQTASTFFYDGASMRQPVPGTVPIGGLITAAFVVERLWVSNLFEQPDDDAISQISTE